ncbi:hypothetical protein CK203_085198 [Vitis vinifera]|uniref:Pentatricopeptide repeat-containing protein n=1 Tax=Vitis vinifera TaxID=29760 RepID=A0A438F6Q1_VITVI|nr:hypothetical protein CK203_085198 [Vitis vinifera]
MFKLMILSHKKGKKTLRKHNVYGLTPSIGSVHHLLLYAKKHNDVGLMVEVMKLLKRNDLPYQSGTADIVFSICYNTDNWQLISMYSKKFVKAGVKLRETTFDTWMEFAAKIGDTESLWKIEKLRSEMMKQHSLRTGFSCAKGFLLERKPDNAASIIQLLIQRESFCFHLDAKLLMFLDNMIAYTELQVKEKSFLSQNLSVAKRAGVLVELQKLISEWSLEVVKRQKEEDRKSSYGHSMLVCNFMGIDPLNWLALAASLITDIPVMVSGLQNMGLELSVSMEELSKEGALT